MLFRQEIPETQPYDVVVCGGGPAGVPAALAAARAGLKVLLLEASSQLGGTGTLGGVCHLLGGRTADNRHTCVAGIFAEITAELVRRGAALDPLEIPMEKYPPHGWFRSLNTGVPFDPFAMATLLDGKMAEAGVEVRFLTSVVSAEVESDRIVRLVALRKEGLYAVPAQAVIDATGDADIAARSGCAVVKGRDEDGLMAPASLIFHVDNVDQDALRQYIYDHDAPRFRDLIAELRERGEWPFAYDIFISVQLVNKGTFMINTTRICGVDGTDSASISEGLVQGRREVQQLFAVMRRHFPGFANARISMVAPNLGIRETRRIVGDYVYTVADVVAGRQFDDVIGYSGYGWDLPDPKTPSHQPMFGVKRRLPYTPIPYRCLVPKPVQNLICPGRAISVERDVLGPLREQAPCYAMGHAAGLAAVQVVRNHVPFAHVDTDLLRQELRQQGAIVDWDEAGLGA